MKLTGYSQQITNVGGSSGGAPVYSGNAMAKVAAGQPLDFSPVIKGLGTVINTIDKVHEQQDNENIMKAMDAYNKSRFDAMYNEQNGFMNAQADGADGIADGYIEAEKKYRQDILGGIKLHSRAKQVALDDLMNKSAQQGYQQVQRHQYQQKEIARDLDLDNNIQNLIEMVQKNPGDDGILESNLGIASLLSSARYEGAGESKLLTEKAQRKYMAQMVGANIEALFNTEDYAGAQAKLEKYGHLLTAEQRKNYGKVTYNKAMAQFEDNYIKNAYAQFGGDYDAFVKSLDGATTLGMDGGANVVDNMRNLIGKIGYYASDGTNCMRTIGMALSNTPYAGQINVDQAIATAKANGQLMNPANYKPQAGDIAVVNDGNHAVMVTENGGTIQNGASRNGVYESGTSAKDMFGSVKFYIRTSDYNNSYKSSEPKPMGLDQKNRLKSQFVRYAADQKRIESAQQTKAYNDFSLEVNSWVTDKSMTYADAMAEARKRAGTDLKLLKSYESCVNSWYKGYGLGGSASASGKGAEKFMLQGAKDMLANGAFANQQEYVEYIQSLPNAGQQDIYQANKDYQDFDNGRGTFAYKMDSLIAGKLDTLGGGKLPKEEKARMTMGLKIYAGQKIADFIRNEKRQPEPSEVEDILDDALTKKTIGTYQAPGKFFKAWTSEENVEMSGVEMGNLGIRTIKKIGNDEYLVVRHNKVFTTNASTIQAWKDGADRQ